MHGCQMSLSHAANVIGAKLIGNDLETDGVSTDTRSIQSGQLFVALKGPHYDAHDYASNAVSAGACALMVEREIDGAVPQLIVDNSLQAMGQLAASWRSQLAIPVIAVTGSNGKTTVKEMIASILGQRYTTLATKGNLNNDIGMPITLLSIVRSHHGAAVIEMGANHPGEIAYLAGIAQPTVALITNAASAHLEGFGSLEGVAHAKGEIFSGLGDDGVAVINADDPFANSWRQLASGHKIISFGLEQTADVTCQWQGDITGSQLKLETPIGRIGCLLKLAGRHNVMNALTATAAALAVGFTAQEISSGLESLSAVPGRLQTKPGINGSTIIDDTYNANPASLSAALEVLVQCAGERYLALGDMGELGEDSAALHIQAGNEIRDAGVDRLYAIGDLSRNSVTAFGERALHFHQHDDLIACLREKLKRGVTLLVKGSRAMHMEQIIEALSDVDKQEGGI